MQKYRTRLTFVLKHIFALMQAMYISCTTPPFMSKQLCTNNYLYCFCIMSVAHNELSSCNITDGYEIPCAIICAPG